MYLFLDQTFDFTELRPDQNYQAFIITVGESGRRSDPIYGTFMTCM